MTRTAALCIAVLLAACGSSSAPPEAVPGATPEVDKLTSIQVVSTHQGWAAGRGYILATLDGGSTWSTQYEGPAQLTTLDFVDSSTGWAVALDRLLGTADGGRCWTQLGEPAAPLVSVHFVDARRGWGVAGGTGPPVLGDGVTVAGGRVSITHAGRVPGIDRATGAAFVDAATGWLVAAAGSDAVILATTDAGRTWTRQYTTGG